MRFFLQQTFSDEIEVAGGDIPGSDEVAGTFEFGVSSVLSPRVLIDLSAEIGVTDDAPDFQIEIGRAHVCTPVTNAHLVCRLLLEKKKPDNTVTQTYDHNPLIITTKP